MDAMAAFGSLQGCWEKVCRAYPFFFEARPITGLEPCPNGVPLFNLIGFTLVGDSTCEPKLGINCMTLPFPHPARTASFSVERGGERTRCWFGPVPKIPESCGRRRRQARPDQLRTCQRRGHKNDP